MSKISKKKADNHIKKTPDSQELIQSILFSLQEKKAEDVVELHFSPEDGLLFDTFIICSANSDVHAEALCENVIVNTKQNLKIIPSHTEGKTNAEWILIDYFNVLVHIFLKEARSFYDLEHLWAYNNPIIHKINN